MRTRWFIQGLTGTLGIGIGLLLLGTSAIAEPTPALRLLFNNIRGALPNKLMIRQPVSLPGFNRRFALTAYASTAIVIAVILPTLISGQAKEWLGAVLNSTVDSQATALTIAQAIEAGQVIVTADVQQYDETTQEVRAIGNASFLYTEAQIEGTADEIQYVPTTRQLFLLGNVQILQQGEHLQGAKAVCSLENKQCRIIQQ